MNRTLISLLLAASACAEASPATIRVPAVDRPPKLEEFLGTPIAADSALAQVTQFIQRQPTDGAPATQSTHVYLGHDARMLYVVWVCSDSDPHGIRAHMSHREDLGVDDFVEVLLDTFNDRRHGVAFVTNPLGVQSDGLWTEQGPAYDTSWDTVWHSEGKLTADGYVVLMAIPFRSLRFSQSPSQMWGITLERYIARNDEKVFWPRVSSRLSGLLSQAGNLTGLDNLERARQFELSPYVVVRGFRTVDARDLAQPAFRTRAAEPRVGVDSKWIMNNGLVLDLTANPDFSQVESDEPQNTVNQRFEVLFPEKRPFFLENANYFDSEATALGLTQLVFTRRIGDPSAGARLSGKTGPWGVATLVADDRAPGETAPPATSLSGKRAYFVIGRLIHDIGKQSNVGAVFTDHEFAGSFNRLGGVETSLKLNANWNAYARALASSTRELWSTSSGNGTNFEFALHGEGRRLYHTFLYQDISANFATQVGFLRRPDIRRLYDYFHFYFRPEGKHLVKWGPEWNLERTWDQRGTPVQHQLNGALLFNFRGNTSIFFPILTLESDTLRPQDFPGLPGNRKFIQDGIGVDLTTAPLRQLSFHLQAYRQGAINVVPHAGEPPTEADETVGNATLSFKPASRLQIDNSYIADRVIYNRLGQAAFNNHVVRSKWNMQWSRELSFRLTVQYDSLLTNPAFTSLTARKNANFDFLITYLLHPGTAIYLGYNSNLENVSPALCNRVGGQCIPGTEGILRNSTHLINNGRLFYIKMSYLFRL
jgi:hypothetical protein